MSYAEHRVQSRNDRTLRPSFAAELLRTPSVRVDTLVDDALGQIGMVLPPVNIRADPLVVDIRIAPFRHSLECGVYGAQRRFHLRQQSFQPLGVAPFRSVEA